MKRSEAIKYIREHWQDILNQITFIAKDGKSFVCPVCGHGKNGDGLVKNRNVEYGLKCYSGNCETWSENAKSTGSGDIFDLYRTANGVDFNKALEEMAALLNITVENERPASAADDRALTGAIEAPAPRPAPARRQEEEPPKVDHSDYYKACTAALPAAAEAVAYLTGRGISVETALKYGLGYDPAADPAGSGHKTARLIIPNNAYSYVGRAVSDGAEAKYKKMNNKGGGAALFNGQQLSSFPALLYVCEGAFDALSLLELERPAVALNSCSNAGLLVKEVQRQQENLKGKTIIIALDNDEAGQKTAREIEQALKVGGIECMRANLCGGHKDINEYIQADAKQLTRDLYELEHKAGSRPDGVQYYIENAMGGDIESFKSEIKTGFSNLDEITGGLYSGLYCIAAISSLGKTTFCLQMADNIAKNGNDVLFFSLEQSRLEAVSKAIARETARKYPDANVNSLQLRKGIFTAEALAAAKEYAQAVGDRLSVIECGFDTDIDTITAYIKRYIERTGVKPVVFIDYLQILQPSSEMLNKGKREAVEAIIAALIQLKKQYNLTIFAISSVNRSNYLAPVDFESLKETGNIEFSCDVVFGMQLMCLVRDPIFQTDKKVIEKRAVVKAAKKAVPREIQLCCLKNRLGVTNFDLYYDYYSAKELFVEKPAPHVEGELQPTEGGNYV